jgi:carbon-monoxide dehydrogenase medium subunit
MKMTKYLQPKTKDELKEAMGTLTEKSLIIAGGTDLMPKIREELPETDVFLSLSKMQDLKEIEVRDGVLYIGAMVTHAMAAKNPDILKYATALSDACSHVGSQQIRNRGTLGGSLINASPAGDVLPCLCLLNATLELMDAQGNTRSVPATEFTQGAGRTVCEAGEVLCAILIPVREDRKSAFIKLGSRKEVTIAQISIAFSWDNKEGYFHPEGYLGAVDTRPVHLDELPELIKEGVVDDACKDAIAKSLRERITVIRTNRKRPPKLKITEAERLYKERAVRSVVYDLFDLTERK